MNAHVRASAAVLRFPVRLRLVSDNPPLSDPQPSTALDALLSAGTIDDRQHAAGLSYADLRRRYDRSGGCRRSWRDTSGLSDEAWQALKRRHATIIAAAGPERFVLDRLCLEDDAPLACEVERVGAALGRLAEIAT